MRLSLGASNALDGYLGGRFQGLMFGGTHENFRGTPGAFLPRITLPERTDSHSTIVSRQTINPSGPMAAKGRHTPGPQLNADRG